MSKLKKALEKAKETREYDNKKPLLDGRQKQSTSNAQVKEIAEYRDELDISYSQTKIHKINSDVLKKGKVISLFHETEKIGQIKTLRTQVLTQLNEVNGNSLLVTSANPYEGKTFTAINFCFLFD